MASPTSVYLALLTSAPTASTPGTEVNTTGTGYARQAIVMPAASNASLEAPEVDFDEAIVSWGKVVGFAVFDAPTGGSMVLSGDFAVAKVVNPGDVLRVALFGLKINK